MPENPSDALRNSSVKTPTHQAVFLRLRDAILFGELKPGQAVTIQGLTAMLDVGITPVREALRRLVSQGALEMHGNRRVTVPDLTQSSVSELEFMRLSLEPELTRRFAILTDRQAISELRRIDGVLNEAIQLGDVPGYLQQNHAFHAAIYAGANAPIMAEAAERLWLRFGPSLRVVCGRFGTQNLPDKHQELLEALEAGNVVAAGEAMIGDVKQGMVQIMSALSEAGLST
jgi:DNA-binding GntR family transcriptional regulator